MYFYMSLFLEQFWVYGNFEQEAQMNPMDDLTFPHC